MRKASLLSTCLNKFTRNPKLQHFSNNKQFCSSAKENVSVGNLQKHAISDRLSNGPDLKSFIIKNTDSNVVPEEEVNIPYLNHAMYSLTRKKVYFYVYGCQMNVNDTEVVWAILKKNNYLKTDILEEADIILLVTCAIRDNAEAKIWHRLDHLRVLKRKRLPLLTPLKIGILGCMAERLKHQLIEREKSVDVVAGPDSYKDLPRLLNETENNQTAINIMLSLDETYADVMPVRLNSQSKSAYVTIMRGCDNMCTYCIVPFTRGRERSRPIESILDEVKQLSEDGVKEVTLLGQNVNSYRDTSQIESDTGPTNTVKGFRTVYKPKKGGMRFAELLDKVSLINPEMRIRFTSPHPKDFPDEESENSNEDSENEEERCEDKNKLNTSIEYTKTINKNNINTEAEKNEISNKENVETELYEDLLEDSHEVLDIIKERPNICNSLHLPAQAGSSAVLERMRRGYTREAYLELVDHVRHILPNVSLSTDIICGFCHETEDEFQETLTLMEKVKFNVAYTFAYSMREKTTAHRRFVDDIPYDIKENRLKRAAEVFRKGAEELHKAQVGEIQLVLIEGKSRKSDQMLAGRNDGNIKVIIPHMEVPLDQNNSICKSISPGDYVAVKIESTTSQSLKGRPLFHSTLTSFHT